MTNIRDMIIRFVRDGGGAHIEVRDGAAGVVFHDEGEFIPFHDLAYNQTYGFYQLSALPGVEPETVNDGWTLHPVVGQNIEGQQYALLDESGYGILIGERWQVVEATVALRLFLERGLLSEPISEDAEELGHRWLTIAEAVAEASSYNPAEYPLTETTASRIRQAARRGTIAGAVQDGAGRWRFQARRFRHWLKRRERREEKQEEQP